MWRLCVKRALGKYSLRYFYFKNDFNWFFVKNAVRAFRLQHIIKSFLKIKEILIDFNFVNSGQLSVIYCLKSSLTNFT